MRRTIKRTTMTVDCRGIEVETYNVAEVLKTEKQSVDDDEGEGQTLEPWTEHGLKCQSTHGMVESEDKQGVLCKLG
jgi:hypothetical protein